jgi:hypothetical protein
VAQVDGTGPGAPPSQMTIHDCLGGTLHYQIAVGDRTVASGTALDSGGGTYLIDVAGIAFGRQPVQITSQVDCAAGTDDQTTEIFADPSGTVVDDTAQQAAIPGATVTLLDSSGSPVPAGDPRLSGATSQDPETSAADGSWGWDVAPGTYRVMAAKSGCRSTVSAPLTVTS